MGANRRGVDPQEAGELGDLTGSLPEPVPPKEPGVGTVYVDTQWEMSKGKTKPGSITAWEAETWKMKSKWFGKSVDLNNPHNQWTNADGSRMFVTNWYGTALATLDTKDGTVLNELEIGPSPSHVVTRTTNGNIVVTNLLSHDIVCYSTAEPACPDGKGGIAETSRIDLSLGHPRRQGLGGRDDRA